MSPQNVQPTSNKALDIVMITLAVAFAIGGLIAFTFLTDQSLGIRLGALAGSLVAAVVCALLSATGKQFVAFCRDSYEELRRVVWPSKKETINTTGLVMAFTVAIAFFLFIVDKFVEWGLYDGLLRITF